MGQSKQALLKLKGQNNQLVTGRSISRLGWKAWGKLRLRELATPFGCRPWLATEISNDIVGLTPFENPLV